MDNPEEDYFQVRIMGKSSASFIQKRSSFINDIEELIKKEEIDSILFYNTSAETFFLKKRLKKRGHTILYEQCDMPSSSNTGLYSFYLRIAEKYLPKYSNLNIGISDFLIKDFKLNAPKIKTIKIPVLVDRSIFYYDLAAANSIRSKYNIKEDDILIGYAGGTWKEEGLSLLLDVFEDLKTKYSNIYLVIAGKLIQSINHDDIAGIVKNKKLEDVCITPGWITTEEVRAYLSASDILVLPQLKHQFNVAGLPTKVAEYSALGKSIVISNVGDIDNYFTHDKDALLCEPSNKASLSRMLSQLIENKDKREVLGENVLHLSKHVFDYTKAGIKIQEALDLIGND